MKTCCAPARDETPGRQPDGKIQRDANVKEKLSAATASIEAGKSLIGTNDIGIPDDGEGPLKKSKVSNFKIGITTVTNAEFAAFVEATGFITEAEEFGWSFVFWSDVAKGDEADGVVVGAEWWRRVDGAYWRFPHGPKSAPCQEDHPVVHVSWNDARAYCEWVGGRLPTEAEWEHAARGGQGDVKFPWGNEEPDDHSVLPCNIWQGDFPNHNTGADGYISTAPAKSFEPNGYGLYNMCGNVWEWTGQAFTIKSLKKVVKDRMAHMKGFKLLKGGSFLCHRSYCYRYRIAARTGNSPESTTSHQSFRVVWDR